MVGVPKSKGCQTCIQRRVKCDLVRPECSQCQRYGVDCPGYSRPHKFMDEGERLHQRFGKKRQKPNANSESIDERIVPSLAARSMDKQQPVIFGSFVLSAFTRWFGLNKYRVHVPWTQYVAQHIGQSPAFDAAVYCMNSVHMGHVHTDTKLQRSSREVYSRALRLFGDRICDASAMKSAESVSITIVLSLFEAYSRTTPDSWARHAAGTALLMAHRGPAAHLTGFDRCLYLSFRSFLVAEAFVNGSRCIFERPEWQAHIDQIRGEDMASPRVDEPIALFIDLQDRIFMEISKVPGLLYQARRLHLMPEPLKASRRLAAQVLRSNQALHTLSSHLRVAATAQDNQLCNGSVHNSGDKSTFIGPIPTTFPQEFANSVLRGCDICSYILCLLLDYLENDAEKHLNPDLETKDEILVSDPLPFRFVSKLACKGYTDPDSVGVTVDLPPPEKWLDLVAASMGLEAFNIITCANESPSSSTDHDSTWSAAVSLR
ncbi:hypothetical protein N7532_003917 [Penicillium argentinense]|uniref:Zn(2)-C6 fungal-type domain-containing protein n=1 Tax=Penicillium argentinense TaxID=1131581 RepID=A0A9W9FNE1_9EURO|nr:uncharacterized protein N7532_003917 [Penicillium argentinense]KAJ5103388.1 hypothetical protein N7532_003917 [Penicillium argentinense]